MEFDLYIGLMQGFRALTFNPSVALDSSCV